MKIEQIEQQLEHANTLLFNECGLFFAFSQTQFNENKTPLKEGEKYVSFGSGGYLPKGNVERLRSGMEANYKAYKDAIKTNNLRLKQIAYELGNHECFYTGNWSVVAEMFPDVKKEVIHRIYRTELKKHIAWCESTGNNL